MGVLSKTSYKKLALFFSLLHCVASQLFWFKNQKLSCVWFVYMHTTLSQRLGYTVNLLCNASLCIIVSGEQALTPLLGKLLYFSRSTF